MTDADRLPDDAGAPRGPFWQIILVVVALAYAAPVAYVANGRLQAVSVKARERLIVEYRLWELHPEYKGTPETWTRFASRLLTDGQLLRRVHAKYGALATEIELDYRRDLSVAQGEVVVVAAAAWGVPVGILYGIGWLVARRRRRAPEPPRRPEKPAYSDARYRP
jgi:hypothetical protein